MQENLSQQEGSSQAGGVLHLKIAAGSLQYDTQLYSKLNAFCILTHNGTEHKTSVCQEGN